MTEKVKEGDWVRLTPEGHRIMRYTPERRGVVKRITGSNRALVIWDGRKSAQDLHVKYLEVCP